MFSAMGGDGAQALNTASGAVAISSHWRVRLISQASSTISSHGAGYGQNEYGGDL